MTTSNTSLEWLAPEALAPNSRNARTHSKKQLRAIAASIEKLGFNAPIVVDEANVVLAGHGRLEAAKLLGLTEVPVLRRLGLSPAKKRAYMLADNKLTERAGWNRPELLTELSDLADALMIEGLDFDLSITGFEPAEIDLLKLDLSDNEHDPADDIDKEALKRPPTSRVGDLWLLGEHRLHVNDAAHHSSIIDVGLASSVGRQKRLQPRELYLGQPERSRIMNNLLLESRESQTRANGNLYGSRA
jgi:ParB-like chromosome segregation protein Spo0J